MDDGHVSTAVCMDVRGQLLLELVLLLLLYVGPGLELWVPCLLSKCFPL